MRDLRQGAPAPATLDIQALLRVALEQGPKDDVEERIMNRVAATTTALEFLRLVFVAPVQWIFDDHLRAPASEEADDVARG